MDKDDLSDLIQRATAGDRKALDRILGLYLNDLHEWASRRMDPRLRAKVDSMDVVQSGMREALRDLGQYRYRGPGSFYLWLRRVVEHKLYAKGIHFRAKRRDVGREVPLDAGRSGATSESGLPVPAPATSPSRKVEKQEAQKIFLEEIGRLKEPHRTVMRLKRKGLTDAQIGTELGKSADAVRKLQAGAMRTLGPRLRRRLGTWPPE